MVCKLYVNMIIQKYIVREFLKTLQIPNFCPTENRDANYKGYQCIHCYFNYKTDYQKAKGVLFLLERGLNLITTV